ncbi:ATP-binding cassette transporter [Cryptococcus wingfieldii CBS 7118]|uniref:ATP-binding cassette transporter n=1 Tax=Cryptococcus wingfieldii CBS 7118 TaxID=1295528 RepID=A0A1E3IFP4_9TREE|nr:ATP-binding cassette transporter [Cryptococcus wingfieldii CBS 7118]ODN87389.1 ATP-binding cassette transporter [Cryptococcus wingfieldii CBS 7118]
MSYPSWATTLADEPWSCDGVWTGIDFSPCFKERYLQNAPYALIALSVLYLLATLPSRLSSSHKPPLSASTLVSPTNPSDLAKLESTVIFEALATNLLPTTPTSSTNKPTEKLAEGESEAIIEDFLSGASKRRDVSRWQGARFWVGLIGAVVWFEVELARAIVQGSWASIVFPAYISVIAIIPGSHITPLVTFHAILSLVLFRSLVISPDPSTLHIIAYAVEIVYWFALLGLPYHESLDRLLSGGKSARGGSNGSYGNQLPKHCEEPASAFSRGSYNFMLPLLFKHYFKPITLEEIPAIREDDSSAAAIGGFRAFQARKDGEWIKKHKQGARRKHIGVDLLWFFTPDVLWQVMYSILFIFFQYLPPTGLRLLLQFVKERETKPQPTHVAVLYVGMMVVGQCTSVIFLGQALALGRRIGVRIRAIIVSEVFVKALRRRDLAGDVKKTETKEGDEKKSDVAGEGKVANMVSVDAFTTGEVCAYSYYVFSCPIGIIVNCVLLYQTLGVASIAGIALLVLLMPVQYLVSKLYMYCQRMFMSATDARLEGVTEVISHVKLIKFNAWEGKFYERMMDTRDNELKMLRKRFGATILFQVLVWSTPVIVTGAAFAVHTAWLGRPLTADTAFASLILFNMLKDPLALSQDIITRLIQAYTSCTRIQAYLDEPDTLKYRQLSAPGPGDSQIGFKNATLGYLTVEEASKLGDDQADPFQLSNLNLSFPVGKVSLVCGPVGSGKTTLILGLLGETLLLDGQVFMPDDHANRDICPVDPTTGLVDSIAYCAQTAWLVGASIRENIVFGSKWDKTRYDVVVKACALERDFEIFELGDETEVGEKGTTCSGGQKARIALARAFYSSAKTIVLDDVLSAVDAHTARHLYNHVLQGPLVQGRTVILVTHQVSLVAPAAELVVLLDNGGVAASGTPSELQSSGQLELLDEEGSEKDVSASNAESSSSTAVEDEAVIEEQLDSPAEEERAEQKKLVDAHASFGSPTPAPLGKDAKQSKQLVAAETSSQGTVEGKTYSLYFKAMGGLALWAVMFAFFFGSQFLQVATNAWIKEWANADDRAVSSTSPAASTVHHLVDQSTFALYQSFFTVRDTAQSAYTEVFERQHGTAYYLSIYWLISIFYLASIAGRVGITFVGALKASRGMYGRLLSRILGAKMRFFDSTPSGRIMNRLSKDMSSIDQETAEVLMYFVNSCLSAATILVVVTLSTPAAFIFALVLICFLYWVVGSLYVTTNREIKRIDSVTRSPIFISFSEVLVGMSTIRSYGDSARFMRKLFHELDQNTRCFWYLWQCNRVLNNWSNYVGALVTIFASLFALKNEKMTAGAVGLSVGYALSFTEYVLWVVRMYAAVEMSMNSVERVGEYLDLEVEEEPDAKGREPPAYWPASDGSIVVENLTCRYAPQLDPVLRDVSFTIGPKEKIGVCGRTGSGKSTLALSFFRFLFQESGRILIDGEDISKLSLHTLRSRLTILPQEAQLFSGTVRDNLDPFDQHSDSDIWEALAQCGLVGKSRYPSRVASRIGSRADLTSVAQATGGEADSLAKPVLKKKLEDVKDGQGDGEGEEEERVVIKSLEENVAVGGKNFSQGQRQLLALARGLLKLRNSSFLIMDESTANLDHATDATIQNVLRTALEDVQMLVIAHRLMTVCGLDKILVLDHGKVMEYGTPWELLQKEGGFFRDLCKQSGEEAQLWEMAKSVHDKKTTRIESQM